MDRNDYFNYLNKRTANMNIEALEKYAVDHHVPIIQKAGLDFISLIIKLTNVKKILEIGSAIGYSAINFAIISDDITVTTIERDELMYHKAINNIKDFALDKRIIVLFNDALMIDENTLPQDFDLLFIDAAKGQYQKFFEKYTKCLKQGGIVITDNLIFHDLIFADDIKSRNTRHLVSKIKAYNEWLKNNNDFETHFINIGDGLSVSIKK